jgi:hypothetical protein
MAREIDLQTVFGERLALSSGEHVRKEAVASADIS